MYLIGLGTRPAREILSYEVLIELRRDARPRRRIQQPVMMQDRGLARHHRLHHAVEDTGY